jgi:hypothetical protein
MRVYPQLQMAFVLLLSVLSLVFRRAISTRERGAGKWLAPPRGGRTF